MNWLLVGCVGGGVTITYVEKGGMTYLAATKLAAEINAMYAAQQSVQADGACTCALIKNETELVIDDLCPVHGSPRR